MTDGRTLPVPDYAGDTGEADPVLLSALDAFDRGEITADAVGRLLAHARLLVPVVAVPVAVPAEGTEGAEAGASAPLAGDKHVEMAMVTVTGRDGRRALPVFTSVAALQVWSADARPVPVSASRAAEAAVEDGAVALLIDPAPRPRFVVQGSLLDQFVTDATTPRPTAV